MKRKMILLFISLLVLSIIFAGCQSWRRGIKDVSSSIGGLNRTVKVYSHDGKLINEYEGRIDIEVNDYGNKVKFDLGGKRIIINNAIVIVEEQ